MGAISGGLEKIWNKKQFLLHSPLRLKLWLVPKRLPIIKETLEEKKKKKINLINAAALNPENTVRDIR